MERQEMALGVLADLLAKLGLPDATGEEPVTLHRRGHWFEPSIAHHVLYGFDLTSFLVAKRLVKEDEAFEVYLTHSLVPFPLGRG